MWDDEYRRLATWGKKEFDTDKLTGSMQRCVDLASLYYGAYQHLASRLLLPCQRTCAASRMLVAAFTLPWLCPAVFLHWHDLLACQLHSWY